MHETTFFIKKFNDTLTYGVLIITTTKSSSSFNSNTGVSILYGITRPSQNDKNMPRVSGRATVATRPPFWNYFHPRLLTSRSQRLVNPVFRPITCSKKKGFFLMFFFVFVWVWFLFLFFIIIIICLLQANRADNDCPCGKENRWFVEKKETEKPLKSRHHYWHDSLPIFVSHSRCD